MNEKLGLTISLEAGKRIAFKSLSSRTNKIHIMYAGMNSSTTFGINITEYSSLSGARYINVIYYPTDLSVIGILGKKFEVVNITPVNLDIIKVPDAS